MDRLDREFGALVDDVIEDELREAAVADAQARQLTRRLTVLAVVVVAVSAVCAGLTALWVRRRIQAPIDALVEGTRQIARGALDHRVRVSGRDELANLALSFNWMVAELAAAARGARPRARRSRAQGAGAHAGRSSTATRPCARWIRPGAGCSRTSAMPCGRR